MPFEKTASAVVLTEKDTETERQIREKQMMEQQYGLAFINRPRMTYLTLSVS